MHQIRILIADPDPDSAKQMRVWIESHGKQFQCTTVTDGKTASEFLMKENIAVLITELILPDVDGFGLLDLVNIHSPEIPVMVVSSHGRPKTREILERKGADSYLEKPLDARNFLQAFDSTFRKIQEGGSLNGTSLDTFAQMIEMEQKTCTLRVVHPPSLGYGILFFKHGEIFHARVPGGARGVDAAYEILAWQPVSLMIENRCRMQEQGVHADLQALLMEAMRLKDERADRPKSPSLPVENADGKADPIDEVKHGGQEDPLYRWMSVHNAHALGIESVYQDVSWRDLVAHAQAIGAVFDAGKLTACYLNAGDGSESIILPDVDTVVALSPACKREQIVSLVVKHPPILSPA